MSSEVNIRESPNHFIVLDAISRGVSSVDKISKVSKLSKTEIELVVNDLVVQRLITSNEKRGFLGRKKRIKITETGRITWNRRRIKGQGPRNAANYVMEIDSA